jgi:hypothetical protein
MTEERERERELKEGVISFSCIYKGAPTKLDMGTVERERVGERKLMFESYGTVNISEPLDYPYGVILNVEFV